MGVLDILASPGSGLRGRHLMCCGNRRPMHPWGVRSSCRGTRDCGVVLATRVAKELLSHHSGQRRGQRSKSPDDASAVKVQGIRWQLQDLRTSPGSSLRRTVGGLKNVQQCNDTGGSRGGSSLVKGIHRRPDAARHNLYKNTQVIRHDVEHSAHSHAWARSQQLVPEPGAMVIAATRLGWSICPDAIPQQTLQHCWMLTMSRASRC